MINYLKNNLFLIIPIVISLISLILSIITLWLTRKRLDVTIEDTLDDISDIYLSFNDFNNNQPSITLKSGKVCFIKVVNPSPVDIAYFDLRVVDITERKPIVFLSKGSLYALNIDNKNIFSSSNENLIRINIPETNYGIFKSNSFTRLDIAFSPLTQQSQILISFKVAISSLSKNKESFYRQNFKYYKQIFNVDFP